MRYTIETNNTAAGSVLAGIYDTLTEARKAATGHHCHIRPIFDAPLADIIAAATLDNLNSLLDNAAAIG
jgi:hypothetical protein